MRRRSTVRSSRRSGRPAATAPAAISAIAVAIRVTDPNTASSSRASGSSTVRSAAVTPSPSDGSVRAATSGALTAHQLEPAGQQASGLRGDVPFGEAPSSPPVVRGDRVDQRLVLGDHPRRLRVGHGQPDQVTDRGPQRHLLSGQPRRLRGRRNLDVDARVGAPAIGQGARRVQPLEVLAQRLHLAGKGALRGEPRRGARDRRAVVTDVAQLVQSVAAQGKLEAGRRVLAGNPDERPAAAPAARLDEAIARSAARPSLSVPVDTPSWPARSDSVGSRSRRAAGRARSRRAGGGSRSRRGRRRRAARRAPAPHGRDRWGAQLPRLLRRAGNIQSCMLALVPGEKGAAACWAKRLRTRRPRRRRAPAGARRRAPPDPRCGCGGCESPTARWRPSTASTSTSPPASSSRCSALRARARRRCCG